MKMKISLTIVFLMVFLPSFSQEKLDSIPPKKNLIFFGDLTIGYASGALKAFSGGFSINYQQKNNLVTFRILETSKIEKIDFLFGFIPYNIDRKTITEYSLLYGKRYIKNEFAFHFSGGISYVNFKEIKDNIEISNIDYAGLPLEIGINWFNPKKERYRAFFGIIPVGKPTSFG